MVLLTASVDRDKRVITVSKIRLLAQRELGGDPALLFAGGWASH